MGRFRQQCCEWPCIRRACMEHRRTSPGKPRVILHYASILINGNRSRQVPFRSAIPERLTEHFRFALSAWIGYRSTLGGRHRAAFVSLWLGLKTRIWRNEWLSFGCVRMNRFRTLSVGSASWSSTAASKKRCADASITKSPATHDAAHGDAPNGGHGSPDSPAEDDSPAMVDFDAQKRSLPGPRRTLPGIGIQFAPKLT